MVVIELSLQSCGRTFTVFVYFISKQHIVFIQVVWKYLYRGSSGNDGGMLYRLWNVINRRNLVKKSKNNVTASKELFELNMDVHILSAAMEVFGMSSGQDQPCT